MLKKIVVWGIVALIAATIVHDTGRYFRTWYDLDSFSKDAATNVAIVVSQTQDRDKAGRDAVARATEKGYRLYGFDIQGAAVILWLEADVDGTWALGPVIAFSKGERDTSRLWDIPIVVRVKARALG
ncbi:MAG: hypothetical protein C0418_04835 [Coriobacteriaceae bacterium]|nr:hypothetical protein [Coriobacteriaceae bacterium]